MLPVLGQCARKNHSWVLIFLWLNRFSSRVTDAARFMAGREMKVEKTREKYEPYSGFSFADPKAWDIKKRLRAKLDKEEGVLQSDVAVAYSFPMA